MVSQWSFAAGQFQFIMPTLAGRTYQVQFTPTLNESPSWEVVRTVTGDGTIIPVTCSASTPLSFNRVVLLEP